MPRQRRQHQVHRHHYSREQRRQMAGEQGLICPYCQRIMTKPKRSPKPLIASDWTLDHKTPLSRGGSDDRDNVQMLCLECNGLKGAMTHEQFLATQTARAIGA